MPSLRSFDDLDGKERGQKKTDDLRAMTTLGPRTLPHLIKRIPNLIRISCYLQISEFVLSIFYCRLKENDDLGTELQCLLKVKLDLN